MRQSVICVVPTESYAEKIVDLLRNAGSKNTDISMLMPDYPGVRNMGHQKHINAPEGTTGACAGAPVGGSLGWLSGVRSVSIASIGPCVVAGPIMGTVSFSPQGVPIGDIAGSLHNLGIQEFEAKQYEAMLRSRNIILALHTEIADEAKRAEEIFTSVGAKDIIRSGGQQVQYRQ